MTDNDYVILVDENGTPYIAHAFGDRFKTMMDRRKNHKYIQRFDNYWGPGKHAYAYTNAEVKLYSAGRRAKKAVKDTARKAGRFVDAHDAGLTERMQANRLNRKAKKAESQGKSGAAAQYRREAERLQSESRQEYDRSGVKKAGDTIRKYGSTSMNAIRKTGKKVGEFVDEHDAGLTEAIEARSARRKKNRAIKTGNTLGISAYSAQEARLREQSRREFEESGIGKAKNSVKNAGKSAVEAVKATSGNVKTVFNNAEQTISDVIDRKVTGASASQQMSASQQNAMMGLDGAIGDYVDAQRAYEKSLKGGNESAIARAAEAFEDAKETVNGLYSSVRGLFSKKEQQAVESALNYELDPVTGEWVTKGR